MLLNRETWKLHRTWAVCFALGVLLSLLAVYDFPIGGFAFPGGSSTVGYLLGFLAGVIILYEVMLWPRKKLLRNWRIGRVRTWMCAHIWLGLLTVPLAIVHSGIPWGGALASATMVFLLLVVGSGIFGLVLQQFLPRKMTQTIGGETIYSQINAVIKQMLAEADALVSAACGRKVGKTDWSELGPEELAARDGVKTIVGASRSIANIYGTAVVTELPPRKIANIEILEAAYESSIRDYLEFGTVSTTKLKDPVWKSAFFQDLADKVTPEAQFVVARLKNWCDEREQLDQQKRLHHWLHYWLAIHLPLSLALLVLLIWHAIAATRYSGIF